MPLQINTATVKEGMHFTCDGTDSDWTGCPGAGTGAPAGAACRSHAFDESSVHAVLQVSPRTKYTHRGKQQNML
jgi:hypothetical protein